MTLDLLVLVLVAGVVLAIFVEVVANLRWRNPSARPRSRHRAVQAFRDAVAGSVGLAAVRRLLDRDALDDGSDLGGTVFGKRGRAIGLTEAEPHSTDAAARPIVTAPGRIVVTGRRAEARGVRPAMAHRVSPAAGRPLLGLSLGDWRRVRNLAAVLLVLTASGVVFIAVAPWSGLPLGAVAAATATPRPTVTSPSPIPATSAPSSTVPTSSPSLGPAASSPPTANPTPTPTPALTPVPTPRRRPTPAPTPAPSVSPAPSASAAPSESPPPSASPSESPPPSASPSDSAAPSVSPSDLPTPSASVAPAP